VALCHGCTRGTCPLPSPDGVATLVDCLQNRVKSITLCVTLNANNGKIVLVTLCLQIEWLYYNAFWYETVTESAWRWLHPGHGGTCPHFYKSINQSIKTHFYSAICRERIRGAQMTGHGDTVSRRTKKNKKLTKLCWPLQKRSRKRLIVHVKPKKWRGTTKNFRRFVPDVPPSFKFVPAPLDRPASSSSSSS